MLIGIGLAIAAAMLVLELFGYRQGRRSAESKGKEQHDGLGVVEAAVFALLGLLLAFLFGGAAERLGDRRDAAVREANAIGTAYLRLDLLPPADAARLRAKLRGYLEARLRAVEASADIEVASSHEREADRLRQEVWSDAVLVVQAVGDREVKQLVIQSLNDVIDIATERSTMRNTHAAVPIQVFLVVLALVGALLAGFSMSRCLHPPWMHMLIFATVVSATIYLIFDMEYPRLGLIRIGAADRPMTELLESMRK